MVWTLVEMDKQVWQLYGEQMATIKSWVAQGQAEGEINSNLSVVWIVSVIDSMMYSASWLIANGDMSAEQVQAQCTEMLANGIVVS